MKSIIMVTLDCVRPDHLGFSGYKGVDTPNIDKLAREGVFFEQAIAQAPNTWVSHASIFSGTNPYIHGVRSPFTKLSPRVKTLAELLSSAGFDTSGFPAHTLMGPVPGFNRGFDYFDINKKDMLLSSAVEGHYYYREWEEMWGKAKKWILSREKPFFLWLHYMGTHELKFEELKIPKEFLEKHSSSGQFYDAKISWADKECIGAVDSFLEENSLKDEVIFLLLSDHGDTIVESRDEKGWGRAFHNSHLKDEVVKIVLLMRNMDLLPQNRKIEHQVRSIDIVPTLLELLNIPVPEYVEGKSLLQLVKNSAVSKEASFAYMENLPKKWIGLRTSEWKLILTEKVGDKVKNKNRIICSIKKIIYILLKKIAKVFHIVRSGESAVGRSQNMKIDPLKIAGKILRKGEVFALYDLKKDPQEEHDVSARHPQILSYLKSKLIKMADKGPGALRPEDLNKAEQEKIAQKLEELGYME